MPQLWQGRASKAVDSRVNDFNSSIRFDARMIEQDIQGSLVHSAMLGRQGIISRQDVDDIHKGLHSILDDLHSGALEIDPNAEDVHTFVEQTLTARVGDAGKRLHTGRSRNDQVALDIRLNLRAASEHIQGQIKELITVLCDQAEKGAGYVMPGYTHLQRAQPVTFGHQLMAYAWMLLRDLGRLQDATRRMDAECPLGSGALAGTTYPLDRFYTAEQLGFAAPCGNSIDGVSDRDFCIELCSAMATCMMHLSRLSEEIILWCSWEFKFIELDDAFTTGSSIMPQKKNPDVTELIRGKTGRVYGDLNTLLVMMKGIPLAYDKDMQEDKEAIFDAVDTLELCLRTVTPMLATMTPLPANMRRAAAKGFINATDCADYLTKKGMPFRDAYKCTGTMVAACIREGKTLEELTLDEFKQYSDLFEDDEIHRLSRQVEEVLYPALEDFALDIMIGKGPSAQSIRINLPRFTLVGATTRAGQLTGPLRDRFGILLKLEPYSPRELGRIILRSAGILGVPITEEGALELARCARGTPRIANRMLKRVRDFATVQGDGTIDEETAIAARKWMDIDELGLDELDRSVLRAIIEMYGGGPVGLETLAAALGEESVTLEDICEPYLMQMGMLTRTPRGRCVTRLAYEHLHMAVPKRFDDEDSGQTSMF